MFLHGKLEERIIVAQLPGFRDQANPDHIYLLQKLLYGLKLSPRCWFQRLRMVLYDLGLVESRTDPSLFLSKQGAILVHLCIYVDGIIVTAPTTDEITRLLQLIRLEFPIRDLSDLKFILGVQVDRIEIGLHLTLQDS